jgi:hypothetical protein
MKQAFIDKNFRDGSIAIINQANRILEEYTAQNLILTLRQLYYQFVARGILPNKQTEYNRLGAIISDARLAGLIDWDMMEDRTRYLRSTNHWGSPADIIDTCATQYKEDLWAGQKYRPEVWIEKDALVGVIQAACKDLRVSYFACRGYASQSAQYEAGHRFRKMKKSGQTPVVFHFGDHDPSGIDMSRDNLDRLSMFAGFPLDLRRLALNMDQILTYNPPPNPAKETDSRASGYIERFGGESWELDALEPRVIDQLIRTNINSLIDRPRWDACKDKEKINKDLIKQVSRMWDGVVDYIQDDPGI